jgi:D-alanine-D-alanine ligase
MALTFNKKMTTRVLATFGLRVAQSTTLKAMEPYSVQSILDIVSLPCFVKPNCGGSSIGTSRVNAAEDLHRAIDIAFKADDQIIIEEFIQGDEVTCGVIQWEGRITALPITQIISKKEFFDYEAKYQGKSDEITPANIPAQVLEHMQNHVRSIYRHFNLQGLVRIDFMLGADQTLIFMEVNTLPGFSAQSIVPQQIRAAGMNETEVLTQLLNDCLDQE